MSADEAVTRWLRQLEARDQDAARLLWQRYYRELVELARARLGQTPRRTADEEDIALSVLRCLYDGAAKGQFAAVVNPDTRKFAFSVPIESFQFAKSLMQEHFNENYMESEKYPNGTFKGEIVEAVDLLKNGTHNVNVKGKLTIHGVEQERTIPATIDIKGKEMTINSKFKVKLVDHKIEIPQVVISNIAEVIDVTVKTNMKLKE